MIPRLQTTENVIARSNSDKAISNLVAQEIARVAFGNSATTLRDVFKSLNQI
jgi:hypothetical protein